MTGKKIDKKKLFGKLVIILAVVCMLASTLPQNCKAESNGGDAHIPSTKTWRLPPLYSRR